ncbi:MAG: amino acid adenylation domain-containing protein [Granulosicoccus sp.]
MNNRAIAERISIIDSIRLHCTETPDKCALQHDDVSVSYAQLESLSNVFAREVLALELGAGQSVALFCERSVHVVAAMLACLKCGVPFVPLDTQFPDERIGFLLADASVGLVITDALSYKRAEKLTSVSAVKLLQADSVRVVETDLNAVQLPQADESCRAYIMYTSGSTGRPKGVPVSQRALSCYCQADIQVYKLTSDDRTLQFSTLSFDISIEEIFPPLISGGMVVLRPSGRGDSQIELSDIVQRFSITAIHLATGYWHEWVDLMHATNSRVPNSIRLMVVTGEKVSPDHYIRWGKRCLHTVLWANAYGPTETTVSATVFVPPAGWHGKALPIGKALPGYSAYILDDQLKPVKTGQTGELYIGGEALADGYLNRPELTEKAFVKDPFYRQGSADFAIASGYVPRLYRTGDLARWLDDDNIEYAGRIDHQLKVGSYRIEPGEIENAINELEGIEDSLVSVAGNSGRSHLVAYVAHSPNQMTSSDMAGFIKLALERCLPVYMVPLHYVLMRKMPKTLNGKIDRKALPDASTAVLARQTDITAPTTATEQVLCDIWQDVLGIPSLGIHDSFLSMGGDSLMAVKVIARVQQQLEFSVSTRDFFFLDTIALLAGHMEGRQVPRIVPPVTTFFINTHQRQVYSVMQSPSPANANGVGVLLVPSLGNEQRRCQRPFRGMMQTLARDGFHLLRFDWQGTGNSSGCCSELRDLSLWQGDLQAAGERLSETVDEIHLVSVRVGALLSAMCSLDNLPFTASYHWDPALSGAAWLNEMQILQRGIRADTYRFLFKRKPRTDDLHEFAGLTIHPELYQRIQSLELMQILRSTPSEHPTHLLVPEKVDLQGCADSKIQVHAVCEFNDWTDPRTTTLDMKINRAASLSADLIRAGLSDR